jgi:ArsR family transcriptional regulator
VALDNRKYSQYFRAFGDKTRLKILSFLAAGERTVSEIVAEVGVTQPTVSRHLAILRDASIVVDRRDGQKIFYSLNKDTISGCCSGFCDCLMIAIPTSHKKKSRK